MDIAQHLNQFFSDISVDARITMTHISVYTAILQSASRLEATSLSMFSYQLMELAKISCGKTYYKAVRELSDFGYIRYEPSFHRNRPSRIHLTVPSD